MHFSRMMPNNLEYVLLFNVLLPFLHFVVLFAQSYSGNIALHKTASQSSTYMSHSASLAVDGNTDTSYTSCADTGFQDYPWWQVDLGDIYEVTSVEFYSNFDDMGSDFLNSIDVFVGNDNVNISSGSICLSLGSPSGIPNGGSGTFNCSGKAVGRYITVMKTKTDDKIILCEFMATGNVIRSSVHDNCLDSTKNCSVYATCNNTDMGYNCTCFDGFIGDGFNCTDIDECLENNGNCSVSATCTNTPGSYNCTCNEGFTGDGFNNCTDIDECQENNGNCSVSATCTNTPGSFYCTCNEGFTGDGLNNCTEIDECLINNGGCDEHATCSNTVGSFECTCQTGYTGDGFLCRDQTAGAGNPTSKCLRRLKRCRICRRRHGNGRCRQRCRCSPDRRNR